MTKNITLQQVIGKIPSGIINGELELNKIIEAEILPLAQSVIKSRRKLTATLGKDYGTYSIELLSESREASAYWPSLGGESLQLVTALRKHLFALGVPR